MRINESHHFYSIQVQGEAAGVDSETTDIEAAISYPEDLAEKIDEGANTAEIFERLF